MQSLTSHYRAKAQEPDCPKLANYTYSWRTANDNLRRHLQHAHQEEYLRLCALHGWRNQLPNTKAEEKAAAEATNAATSTVLVFSEETVNAQLVRFLVSTDQVHIFCDRLACITDRPFN